MSDIYICDTNTRVLARTLVCDTVEHVFFDEIAGEKRIVMGFARFNQLGQKPKVI